MKTNCFRISTRSAVIVTLLFNMIINNINLVYNYLNYGGQEFSTPVGNDITYHWYVITSQTVLLLISMTFVCFKCNSNFAILIQLCLLVLLVALLFIEIMTILRTTFLLYQRINANELRNSRYYSNGMGAQTDENPETQFLNLYPIALIISLGYFAFKLFSVTIIFIFGSQLKTKVDDIVAGQDVFVDCSIIDEELIDFTELIFDSPPSYDECLLQSDRPTLSTHILPPSYNVIFKSNNDRDS